MSAQRFAMDYIDVATRIVEFRTQYPEGCLQQISLDFREVAGGWWVIYTAAAFRGPGDERPGHGTAWEPVPGKTNFTRDSEVQNAETAAWGRAIVAVLAADTKKGIASAEEVRNRQVDEPKRPTPTIGEQRQLVITEGAKAGYEGEEFAIFVDVEYPQKTLAQLSTDELKHLWKLFNDEVKTKEISAQQGALL